MVKSVVIIGIFILLLSQVVSAGEQIEKKTGKSRIILVKKYECQPFTILVPEHPTSAVAVIANQGIIVASWDSLSEFHLSLYDFSGALLRSVKHPWGFPTHLYYNTDRKRLYFWHTSFPHNTISRRAYVMDTNLAVIDSFSVSSFPDWFIKVGILQSNRRAEVENILKKIRKIAGENGYGYAEKDM
ncbi:MAG: hypothetical protein IPM69_13365 [Ignavibacteria bacterium]|nr:hypothetical protein [Ignavibacteria bacterium]